MIIIIIRLFSCVKLCQVGFPANGNGNLDNPLTFPVYLLHWMYGTGKLGITDGGRVLAGLH
jgi:hypothetical protein